jgi:hypothetical protein
VFTIGGLEHKAIFFANGHLFVQETIIDYLDKEINLVGELIKYCEFILATKMGV